VSDPRPGRQRPGLTPADLPSDEPGWQRPPRPVAVELATAIVIVSGVMSVLQSIEAYARLAQDGADTGPLVGLALLIGIASVVIGVLLRTGRAWLVGLNVLAVAGFLELISGVPIGWVFGGLDVMVVLVLLVHRPWFAWTPGGTGDGSDDDRRISP
jgi:hypothetical protein